MAVTLVSTGVKFPDNSIQTSAASGLPAVGTLTVTVGATNSGATSLGSGGAGWYYFANKTNIGSINNVIGYTGAPLTQGGLFYANSTPSVNSQYYNYNSGSGYNGGGVSWKKI